MYLWPLSWVYTLRFLFYSSLKLNGKYKKPHTFPHQHKRCVCRDLPQLLYCFLTAGTRSILISAVAALRMLVFLQDHSTVTHFCRTEGYAQTETWPVPAELDKFGYVYPPSSTVVCSSFLLATQLPGCCELTWETNVQMLTYLNSCWKKFNSLVRFCVITAMLCLYYADIILVLCFCRLDSEGIELLTRFLQVRSANKIGHLQFPCVFKV